MAQGLVELPPPVNDLTKVITRSDIGAGRMVASLDNSVWARMNDDSKKLAHHPESEAILRLLALLTNLKLQSEYGVEFVISQALHYDRINDRIGIGAAIRHSLMPMVAKYSPANIDVIKMWPVVKVDALLSELPEPETITQATQDEVTCDIRMTTISKDVDQSDKASKAFRFPVMQVKVPLCVYKPGLPEDKVAAAFGFDGFSSVTPNRIVDVCHAASHLRFSKDGDVLLTLDKHFVKSDLSKIGIVCLTPAEFMTMIDPSANIAPIEFSTMSAESDD